MKCNYCEWRCELRNGRTGMCRMYQESGGKITERFPGRWCTYSVYRIESVPLYHVYPGSRSMTIGTAGCNMSCMYCSNAFIAREDPEKIQSSMYDFTPDELVRMAVKKGCNNIVFNVNEPAVSLPSLLELSKSAKKEGLPMGCLTNAYTTPESTEILASIFSFMNISLKGLAPAFCGKYLGIPDINPVLRNIKMLSEICHVEITTPVIESANDNELETIAGFLSGVDREMPWHVFRLLPEYRMKDAAYPDIEAINMKLERCRDMLHNIYFHNFVGSDWVNTTCPDCGETMIERFSLGCGGDRLKSIRCSGGICPVCGHRLKLLCGDYMHEALGVAV